MMSNRQGETYHSTEVCFYAEWRQADVLGQVMGGKSRKWREGMRRSLILLPSQCRLQPKLPRSSERLRPLQSYTPSIPKTSTMPNPPTRTGKTPPFGGPSQERGRSRPRPSPARAGQGGERTRNPPSHGRFYYGHHRRRRHNHPGARRKRVCSARECRQETTRQVNAPWRWWCGTSCQVRRRQRHTGNDSRVSPGNGHRRRRGGRKGSLGASNWRRTSLEGLHAQRRWVKSYTAVAATAVVPVLVVCDVLGKSSILKEPRCGRAGGYPTVLKKVKIVRPRGERVTLRF